MEDFIDGKIKAFYVQSTSEDHNKTKGCYRQTDRLLVFHVQSTKIEDCYRQIDSFFVFLFLFFITSTIEDHNKIEDCFR